MKYLIMLTLLVSCGKSVISEEGLRIKDFEKTCLEGHVYFFNYGGQYGGSFGAIKLDQNGKPVKCSMVEVENV